MLFTTQLGQVIVPEMRFRPYFGWRDWTVCAACFLLSTGQILRYLFAEPRISHLVFAVGWMTVPILGIAYHVFLYWDVNPDGLTARSLWKVKRIPWQSVRSVGKLWFFPDRVMIRYGHSIDDHGWFLAVPANRSRFVAALRKYAPQAEFKE